MIDSLTSKNKIYFKIITDNKANSKKQKKLWTRAVVKTLTCGEGKCEGEIVDEDLTYWLKIEE